LIRNTLPLPTSWAVRIISLLLHFLKRSLKKIAAKRILMRLPVKYKVLTPKILKKISTANPLSG
jgi:hypothetical protein